MFSNFQIITYVLSVLVLILIGWNIRNEIRLKKIFAGKKAADLEEVLVGLNKDVGVLKEAGVKIFSTLENNDKRIRRSIQGLEVLRFNPFKESGGNQSFSIAFLNEEGDGLVLSSLYSRERVSIFAKPVKNMASEFELTGEEKESLKKAKLAQNS